MSRDQAFAPHGSRAQLAASTVNMTTSRSFWGEEGLRRHQYLDAVAREIKENDVGHVNEIHSSRCTISGYEHLRRVCYIVRKTFPPFPSASSDSPPSLLPPPIDKGGQEVVSGSVLWE